MTASLEPLCEHVSLLRLHPGGGDYIARAPWTWGATVLRKGRTAVVMLGASGGTEHLTDEGLVAMRRTLREAGFTAYRRQRSDGQWVEKQL